MVSHRQSLEDRVINVRNDNDKAGTVTYSKVIMKMDGISRGFGFVEMESEEQAKAAIEKLNQSDFKGRTIVVNEARTQTKGNFDSKERNYN